MVVGPETLKVSYDQRSVILYDGDYIMLYKKSNNFLAAREQRSRPLTCEAFAGAGVVGHWRQAGRWPHPAPGTCAVLGILTM
jgi:hypothetical protein